ncbi:CHAT domain-containing tetratricopeptide repeat protein [Bryobacter aggregatus]|uniref:CHAT domain-containing tetratricopeptide repeat protein n=1 Tax=Bryobacter aggregatus TaxID=360054 RepID=UPI00138DE8AB|nr:CHAT domain-containing protein [Bryobacter aggregatus]
MNYWLRAVRCLVLLAASSGAQEEWRTLSDRQIRDHDLKGAQVTLDLARAAAVSRAGAHSEASADIDLRLAYLRYLAGDYRGVHEISTRALQSYETALGPRSLKSVEALVWIGSAHSALNEYSQAQEKLTRALEIHQQVGAGEDVLLGRILNQLAGTQIGAGDFAAAKITIERAIAVLEGLGASGEDQLSTALRQFAYILTELGDFAGARLANQRSLAILTRRGGEDAVSVADLLVVAGNGEKDAGNWTAARDMHRRAVAIYEKRLGPENTRSGGALDSLGQDLLGLKDYAGARLALERAVKIQTAALGARHVWTANAIQGLGQVAAAEGKYEEARQFLEQTLDIWREKLGDSHPFTLNAATRLAEVLGNLGRREDAFALALETTRRRRDYLASTLRTVEERQALRYASSRTKSLDLMLSYLGKDPQELRAAWDVLIRMRVLVLDEMAARQRAVRQVENPQIREMVQQVMTARSNLARLAVQGKGAKLQADFDAQMEAHRASVDGAEANLAVHSRALRIEIARERAGLAEVQAALPQGATLVGYVRQERYLAFVWRTGEGTPRLVDLGAATRIDRSMKLWRAELDRERDAAGRNQLKNEASYRELAASLRKLVWDPLGITGKGPVFVVADGSLQALNFAALVMKNGQYLAEAGPLVHLLGAERDLVGQPESVDRNTRMFALGNASFAQQPIQLSQAKTAFRGLRPACEDFATRLFEPLPGSAAEVRSIAQIWRQRGWKADVFTGSGATESALKAGSAQARVVHVATHGYFLESCAGSNVAMENPLLRSGLALAGANHRQMAKEGQDDGILTAEEASTLDLSAAEWVVLSGCDTGVGELRAGEGILGLRRAFQQAGARTIITSLWPVDDEETRRWMTLLYRQRFQNQESTVDSLRTTNRLMIRSLRSAGKSTHPYHWAAFVAIGDWR